MRDRIPAASRFVVIVPVIGLFAASVTLVVMAAIEVARAIGLAVVGELDKKTAVLDFIELADVFLLATVLYIMALGLYELFVDPEITLPSWLVIKTLDDLKEKLVGVVVVVLAVSFLGTVIKAESAEAVMQEGVGIAAVTAALGYFLSRKSKG
ncbi:MAG: YqhA family protein [Coriobacteriia bacterium]|nr:YqhA family protein [Coriobacteriia bacterium]